MSLRYRRILIKLSGEALAGARGIGIDAGIVARFAGEIAEIARGGTEVAVVVGGGNLFRGAWLAERGTDRVTGDHMGMLATVMNGLALREAVAVAGVPVALMSGFPVPQACETFTQRHARAALARGEVLILVGGTGNPFFTTDTTAALRAAELGCDAILKGTQVDGVYSADPRADPNATRFDHLTFDAALDARLAVMDTAAFALARDNAIPIIVFAINPPGALIDVVSGRGRFTVVAR